LNQTYKLHVYKYGQYAGNVGVTLIISPGKGDA